MADYRRLARIYAHQYGLPEQTFERQIGAESNFNPGVHSQAGAIGIAQIMPGTAKAWGVDPNNPEAALNAAAKHMAEYYHKYGSYENALRAYNAGPGNIQKSHGFAETNAYVKKILNGQTPAVSSATAAASAPTASSDASSGISNLIDVIQRLNASRQPTTAPGTLSMVQSMNDQIANQQAQSLEMIKQLGQTQAKAADTSSTDFDASTPTAAAPKGKGVASFGGAKVASWIAPILEYARQHGWKGSVNSGVRSLADQTRIYNSGVRPAAKPGTSNHEMTAYPGGAVDVSEAQQLSDILKRSKYRNLLVWAGSKDPVHFSHPHNGSY